jgi:hypothetical protein
MFKLTAVLGPACDYAPEKELGVEGGTAADSAGDRRKR